MISIYETRPRHVIHIDLNEHKRQEKAINKRLRKELYLATLWGLASIAAIALFIAAGATWMVYFGG